MGKNENPVFAWAMQQYWTGDEQPPYLWNPDESGLSLRLSDFTYSLATYNKVGFTETKVCLESTNENPLRVFNMVVIRLEPTLSPDEQKCRSGVVGYRDGYPDWRGHGITAGRDDVYVAVDFIIVMNDAGIARVHFNAYEKYSRRKR